MSTFALDSQGVARKKDRRPSLLRLTAVELEKMVNTRSGFWVMLGIAGATVVLAFLNGLAHAGRQATYIHVFHDASQPLAFLLPVLGVLLICSEWTQRTTLTTFALVPDRRRVLAAKINACLLVSLAALILSVIASVVVVAAFGHARHGAGVLPASVIFQGWVHLAAWMMIGLAFGTALLASTPAIVAYLLLPIAFSGAVDAVHGLDGVSTWLNITSFNPMTLHALSATEWAHVIATMALWVGVPLLVGLVRVRGRDIA
jgi:ABC-2 type transport system permease protein